MAEEQKQPNTEPQQAMESQVTSKTPTTKPEKNPNRVQAARRAAEKRKQAREAQKQALAEAHATIEKYKRAEATSSPAPEPVQGTEPKPAAADSGGFTRGQVISIITIVVTLITTYVKRDDITAFFTKKQAPEPAPPEHAPLPQPVSRPRKGVRFMDD